jgi:ribonuclease P protein component
MKANENLLGVVASKKVGNAVYRNRSKRLLRALFREETVSLAEGSYVLVAKAAILKLSFESLQEELVTALKRVGAKNK